MRDPAVTVLTAVRDGAPFLPQAIDSIRAQTFEDWELVVVDDASTDDSPGVVEAFARQDERVRLVRRGESGGPYVAANTGLAASRGRFIVRLDADDVAMPDRIERQLAFLQEQPAFRAVLGGWRQLDDQGKIHGPARKVHTRSGRVLRWSLCVMAGVVHSSLCIEREVLEHLGGYAEMPTSADLKLWCQLTRRDWLGISDDVVVAYRKHASQISQSRHQVQLHWSPIVLKEHLEEMGGESWALEDVRALRGTGRWHPVPFDRGLAVLDRWERLWRADRGLRAGERRELVLLGARVRLRHIRYNRKGLVDTLRGATALAPLWMRRGRFRTQETL